jgi:hypothetical protein
LLRRMKRLLAAQGCVRYAGSRFKNRLRRRNLRIANFENEPRRFADYPRYP